MYRIGEFSKMTKTTIKTLRYYDEVGLLGPAHVDPENGYRYDTINAKHFGIICASPVPSKAKEQFGGTVDLS